MALDMMAIIRTERKMVFGSVTTITEIYPSKEHMRMIRRQVLGSGTTTMDR